MASWDEVVREHGPAAYKVAWRILRHQQDCEDVLQDVFIEAHKQFVADEVSYWRTYLYQKVTFRALDALRRRRQTDELHDTSAFDKALGPEEIAMEKEEARQLRAMVAELPARQAAVFCLVHFEQLTHDDVAISLNISLNAVAMALHKARNSLRETMSNEQRCTIDEK